MSEDLIDEMITFVRLQLDEDERVAIEAARAIADHTYAPVEVDQHAEAARHWHARRWLYQSKVSAAGEKDWQGGPPEVTDSVWTEVGEHIARHDPARVLREVEAKRKILDDHAPVVDGTQSSWKWFEGSESESERILRLLALPYSDRPGYQEQWRP